MSVSILPNILSNTKELTNSIEEYLTEQIKCFNRKNYITIGVSGGSMPQILCPIFQKIMNKNPENWKKIVFFAVDERLVPHNSNDCNISAYQSSMPDQREKFLAVDENTINNGELAANEYEKKLLRYVDNFCNKYPVFDILFLGIGPDGHTCSLFPEHELLKEKNKTFVLIENSPKPPPRRITITLPIIQKANSVAFIVNGKSKAEIVKEILESNNKMYPPTIINQLRNENTTKWFLDKDAASCLSIHC